MRYSAQQQSAIKKVLIDVLSTTKPEETFLVDHVFDSPVDVGRRSDALGFGGDVQVILLMYPIFGVLCDLAKSAGKGFAEKWGQQLADWLFGKKRNVRLEPAALTHLRDAVVLRLTAEGVGRQVSERVGDSVLGVLCNHPELLHEIVAGG